MDSDYSDSPTTNTSSSDSSSEEDIHADRDNINSATSLMYSLALDPRYELSEHSSDDEICSAKSYDTDPEETTETDQENCSDFNSCSCGKCPTDNAKYCCSDVSIALQMSEVEQKICITDIDKFKNCIMNSDVLELIAYSMDKLKIYNKDKEAKNRLLRYTQ